MLKFKIKCFNFFIRLLNNVLSCLYLFFNIFSSKFRLSLVAAMKALLMNYMFTTLVSRLKLNIVNIQSDIATLSIHNAM